MLATRNDENLQAIFAEMIHYPEHVDSDYCQIFTSDEGVTIGACEIRGKRKEQEDRLAAAVKIVSGFPQIPFRGQKCLLSETFSELQATHGQARAVGTTCCMATAWIDNDKNLQVTTANLGDSSAYVVILNADGTLVFSSRLNTLHKPTNPDEMERIELAGGFVSAYRLNGILSLSRAFGDTGHEGISHTPDITVFTRPVKEGETAYILVACDGLDTIDDILGDEVSKYHNEHQHNLCSIAHSLVMSAYYQKSSDNISVALFAATSNPVSIAIFDGHGGAKLAKKISHDFYETLAKYTLKLNEPGWLETIEEKIAAEAHALAAAIQKQNEEADQRFNQLKQKMEFHLTNLKHIDAFHVYFEVIERDFLNKLPRHGKITFATNTMKAEIEKIEAIAIQHRQFIYTHAKTEDDIHPTKHRRSISYYAGETIPETFDTFMREAIHVLEERKIIERTTPQPIQTQTGMTFFDTPHRLAINSIDSKEINSDYSLR